MLASLRAARFPAGPAPITAASNMQVSPQRQLQGIQDTRAYLSPACHLALSVITTDMTSSFTSSQGDARLM